MFALRASGRMDLRFKIRGELFMFTFSPADKLWDCDLNSRVKCVCLPLVLSKVMVCDVLAVEKIMFMSKIRAGQIKFAEANKV